MPTRFVIIAYLICMLMLLWDFISPRLSLNKIRRRVQLKIRKQRTALNESDTTQ